ncbi:MULTISPECIES: hypothetical protein [Bacillus cereus group]|uniref:hypothetical protein n=1 Tax=Bacillus cereus group TaxID=86661 RepID=UPI000BF49B43|nr:MULTISPECIES: hypothetical protein [Bacillus cereus group]PEW70518.1 hypothetical protein CN448_10625 [Bacillus cereus]
MEKVKKWVVYSIDGTLIFIQEIEGNVISESTTSYGIANSFKKWFAIEKAKCRIDTNKERVDLWIKGTNAKY